MNTHEQKQEILNSLAGRVPGTAFDTGGNRRRKSLLWISF